MLYAERPGIIWSVAASVFLLVALPTYAENVDSSNPSHGAILRCDPALIIQSLDGSAYREAHFGSFSDCSIDLDPGEHKVSVCYDASTTSAAGQYLSYTIRRCDKDKEILLTARPGHIYRLKVEFAEDWRPWIEDVTASESNLPLGTAERKDGPKVKGGEKRPSWLLARVNPREIVIGLANGSTKGIWFHTGWGGGAMKASGDSKEFAMRKVSPGDTVALISANFLKEQKYGMACGETRIPVVEDIPGGRVLYLGDFTFEKTAQGYKFSMTNDGKEEARRYLEREHPEMVESFDSANFRMLRSPNICLQQRGHELANAP